MEYAIFWKCLAILVSGRTGSFLQLSPEKGGSCKYHLRHAGDAAQNSRHRRPSQSTQWPGAATHRGSCLLRSLARRHRPLLFALLLGLSVFAVSYNLLSAYIRTEKVVVAARYLEPYRQISVSDIKVVELPRKGIHPDSIRKPEELIGNYTVCPLFAGQLVLAGHVMSSHNRPGISLELPAEGRAIFVPADASRAVGGLVNPETGWTSSGLPRRKCVPAWRLPWRRYSRGQGQGGGGDP